MNSADTQDSVAVDSIVDNLEARFGTSLTPLVRAEIAHQAIDRFRDAPVQSFVTILAQRLAVEIAAQRLHAA